MGDLSAHEKIDFLALFLGQALGSLAFHDEQMRSDLEKTIELFAKEHAQTPSKKVLMRRVQIGSEKMIEAGRRKDGLSIHGE